MSGIDSLKDVALRPWPAPEKDELSKDALLQQIEQLTTERGHLRDITEQSLQEDIDAGKNIPDDAKEGSEDEDDEKEAPSRKEKMEEIFKMQMEMAGHLEYA
jgi:mediator of RNA polymerase II transcription subunit 17